MFSIQNNLDIWQVVLILVLDLQKVLVRRVDKVCKIIFYMTTCLNFSEIFRNFSQIFSKFLLDISKNFSIFFLQFLKSSPKGIPKPFQKFPRNFQIFPSNYNFEYYIRLSCKYSYFFIILPNFPSFSYTYVHNFKKFSNFQKYSGIFTKIIIRTLQNPQNYFQN